MLETSFSNISKDYYISNKKIYSKNNNCYKISNIVKFDAEKFAEWMQAGFKKSPHKTITELARVAISNKATISRLMSGAAQTLTNKPSQPNRELVKRLAKIFDENENNALMLAGYAPDNVIKLTDDLEFMDFEGFDAEDLEEIRDFIRFKKLQKQKEL
jgi:hypothetical protein